MSKDATVVTRFAPSPTGYLHIGGGRTALFNWLFSRHHGGKFLLRIEDTDRERSTEDAIAKILDGMRWLGLDWDGEPVFQFARAGSHAQRAQELLESGKAYKCFATAEELEDMRARARAEGRTPRYDGRWRDRDPADAPPGAPFAVRLKAPQEGATIIHDLVQGDVVFQNDQLDDMVLLRSDGTPTYMLAVVVDDIDMGITHILRGDDHLTNAARQTLIYDALGAKIPAFGHIPMIHGPDGAKLSKRHGALGVEAYRDMGYLPEAMRNYLLRLGWSHGDDEIITTEQAIGWFNVGAIGRSPSRLDLQKLDYVNSHYMRLASDARLAGDIAERLGTRDKDHLTRLVAAMPGLKERAKNLVELAKAAHFLILPRPLALDDKAKALLTPEAKATLKALHDQLAAAPDWTAPALEALVRDYATAQGIKLGAAAQPLRAALSGATTSPPIFDVLVALGRAESLGRLADQMA